MKYIYRFLCISFLLGMSFTFMSCDPDETSSEETGIPGLPSVFTYTDGSVVKYKYTNGNRLSRIEYGKSGGAVDLTYNGSDLVKLQYSRPKGTGSVTIEGAYTINFSKTGNKILATIDLDNSVSTDTIEVGNNGYLNRIGCPRVNNFTSIYNPVYLFETEGEGAQARLTSRQLIYVHDTYSETKSKLVYTYDQHPGSTSQVDLPRWFVPYYLTRFLTDNIDYQLLNTVNNRVKETFYIGNDPTPSTFEDFVNYDSTGYPTSVTEGRMGTSYTIAY